MTNNSIIKNGNAHPYKDTAYQTSVEKSQRAEMSYNTFKDTEEKPEDVTENKRMESTYQQMNDTAIQAQQKYEDALNAYANRISPENPYSNKNVELVDGTKGYVNNLGYFQPYKSINNTASFNKCPSSSEMNKTQMTMDDVSNPIAVTTMSDDKSGNTSCGLEGKNVFVVGTVAGAEADSLGCYETSSSLAPYTDKYTKSDETNVFSYADCKYVATQQGKPVFGLSNYNEETGYSSCLLGDNANLATSTRKSNMVKVEKTIFNSKGAWVPKENPEDVIIWEPLHVGGSNNRILTIKMPTSNMVVGDKCVHRRCHREGVRFNVRQFSRRSGGIFGKKHEYLRLKRLDKRHGWGGLILPMFSTENGNAERGLAYMNTSDGLQKMRQQMEDMYKNDYKVQVMEHCNGAGWKFNIPVGSHIPDTRKARIVTDFPEGVFKNISTASMIEAWSPDVSVTVYNKENYTGKSATFRGRRRQSLCERIPGSNAYWNDRVRSMKVERVDAQPFLKINTTGFIPPKMDVPIKSIKVGNDGRIEFYSQSHRNGEILFKWPMVKPPPNDIITDYMLIVKGVDSLGKEFDELFKEVPPGLQLVRFALYPQYINLRGRKVDNLIQNGQPVGRYVSYFGVDLTGKQIQSLKKAQSNEQNFRKARSRNYIAGSNMWLNINDILSAPDGKVMLEITPNGSGVSMKIEEVSSPCTKDADGNKTTSGEGNVAIYALDKIGDPSLYGKLGYVDYNGKMHEYNPSDIVGDNTFMDVEERRGLSGNDLPGQPIQGVKNIEEAKKKCLENEKCFGVVYEPQSEVAYLKDYGVMTKISELQRNSMFVKRRVKPNPEIFNAGCDEQNVTNTTSVMYGNYPSAGSGYMKSSLCDRNRFLNEPAMQTLKDDWRKKRDDADKFGVDVRISQSGLQSNLGIQQTETAVNTKTNALFNNVYHDTSERKNPTAVNPTSKAMNPIREPFTPLSANRNLQPELGDPTQRANTIKFRNIDSIIYDSNLLVDESQVKLVLWSVVGIATAIIGGKLITKLKQ